MNIGLIIPESTIDYPKKFGPVLFTNGCNFHCGFCHNSNLSSSENKKSLGLDMMESFIKSLETKARTGWYNGLCISGGEPTMQRDLPEFIQKLKSIGLSVKLDTNGSNPRVLSDLLRRELVDYVAMDVKAPREFYSAVAGREVNLSDIEESINTIQEFPDYEFRTTLVPFYSNGHGSSRFMSAGEAGEIAGWISRITGGNKHKYYLQGFVPRKDGLIDSTLERFPKTPDALLQEAKSEASKYLYKTEIRG